MNEYHPCSALEAENLLAESVGTDPQAIVIVRYASGSPVEILKVEGIPIAFSSLGDCKAMCSLLGEAYDQGEDDGRDRGYEDGHEDGFQEGKDEGFMEGETKGRAVGYAAGTEDAEATKD